MAVVLGIFVVLLSLADAPLLLTPVIEFLAGLSAALSVIGIVLCLAGLNRRSQRFRAPGFWTALAGGFVMLLALGFIYFRAAHMSSEKLDTGQDRLIRQAAATHAGTPHAATVHAATVHAGLCSPTADVRA